MFNGVLLVAIIATWIFIDENDWSHLHVVLKRQALLWTNFLSSGKCSHGKDRQKLIASVTL